MAGRWLRLAVRAHYDKAIDFSEVSQEDAASLYREKLILDEAERRLAEPYLATLLNKIGQSDMKPETKSNRLDGLDKIYVRQMMPWLNEEDKSSEEREQNWEEYYHTIMAAHKKNKEAR